MLKSFSIKKFIKDNAPEIAWFLVITVLFMIGGSHWGDDVIYKEALRDQGLFPYLKWIYNTISSRLIIDTFLMLTVQSDIIWAPLSAFLFVLIAYSIRYIFTKELKNDQVFLHAILLVLATYNLTVFYEAGWCATVLNTIWPLSFGLYAMRAYKDVYDRKEITPVKAAGYLAATVFACNQEQMCAIILCSVIIFGGYLYCKEKKISRMNVIQFVIAVLSIIFILTCPGNANRTAFEMADRFPEFEYFSIVKKAFLGFANTSYVTLISPNTAFLVFAGVLLFITVRKTENWVLRGTASIPLLLTSSLCIFLNEFKAPFFFICDVSVAVQNFGSTKEIKPDWMFATALIVGILLFGSMIVTVYNSFDNMEDRALAEIVLFAGLASRMIMGFSPTVYASGFRTSIYLMFAMIIIAVMAIDRNRDEKMMKILMPVCVAIAVINVLNCYMVTLY